MVEGWIPAFAGISLFLRCGAYREDFLIGRKPAGLLLRERQLSVDGDLEHPSYARHQLDFGAVFLFQHCPRTEGPRLIVSRLAPLDSDLHRVLLARSCRPQNLNE